MKKLHTKNITNFGIAAVFFCILIFSIFFLLRKATYITLVLRISSSGSLNAFDRTPVWFYSQLKKGVKQTNTFGQTLLEITDVYSYPTNDRERTGFVTMRARATYNKRTNEYTFNGVPLLVGSYQKFRLSGYQISGLVYRLNPEDYVEQLETIQISGYLDPSLNDPTALSASTISDGVPTYMAENFVEGLTMKDSDGKNILTITKVKKTPGTRMFAYQDRLIYLPDSSVQNVYVEADVITEKIDQQRFFRKDIPMNVNSSIPLEFNGFGSELRVTKIN